MVAYVALAVAANIFLSPLMTTMMEWLLFNAGVAALSSNLVMPQVIEWFAHAKNYHAQGEKEEKIHAILEDLRKRPPEALREEFTNLGINTDRLAYAELANKPELALLARVIYRQKESETLFMKAGQLKAERKYGEAIRVNGEAAKAKTKAAYFALLMKDPNIPGKFKDSFEWVNRTVEQQAILEACEVPEAKHLAATRRSSPQILYKKDVCDNSMEQWPSSYATC